MVVAFIIYAIGLIMQGTMNLEVINETHMYNQAIDALKEKYKEELEKLNDTSITVQIKVFHNV